ncbi:hypothetical protein LIER_08137 [Lithospermum erythrorhizon]|uniref:Uncharacterized protein n=1 Tax=Lithospermum erythrorhizon TaxID=34254 RepID=A0AAV3PCV0_LITER
MVLTNLPTMDEKVSMITFFHGLQFGPLKERLVLELVANVHQLAQLTVKYIKLEEGKRIAEGAIKVHPKSEPQRCLKRKAVWDRLQRNPRKKQRERSLRRENGRVRQPQEVIYNSYTPLKTRAGRVYSQMEDMKLLPKAHKLRSVSNRQD